MKQFVSALIVACAIPCVLAQSYPAKPIRLIVPYTAGSSMDIIGRILAPRMLDSLGQPMIVDNRAGAGGNLGTAAAAKSVPDGYTVVLGALGPLVQNAVLYASATFDPVRDFAAISLVATGPILMAVHPSIPVKNLKELVELAKRRPGQISYGSGGIGSATHIAGEMIKFATGIDTLHVPYRGNVESITGMITGQVSMVYSGAPPLVGLAKAGKLRLLATTGPRRMASVPAMMTVAESGYPAAEMLIWYGVVAPAGTPREAIGRLNGAIVKAMNLPEVRDQFAQQGLDPESNTPEQFAQIIRDDYTRWGKIIRAAGIKLE